MSSSNHATSLSFTYPSSTDAERVAASLRPELERIAGDRTTASLSRAENRVCIEVSAADLTALRAGQNTWLTLVEVAERVADTPHDGT